MCARTRDADGARDGTELCLLTLAHVQHVEQTRARRAVGRRLAGTHEVRVGQCLEHSLVAHRYLRHHFRRQCGRLARELYGRNGHSGGGGG